MFVGCELLMKKSKILIYLQTGNMFFDNKNSSDSTYDIFYAQQNYYKKLLKMKLAFVAGYYAYISKNLPEIKAHDDNKYNMLTNKN